MCKSLFDGETVEVLQMLDARERRSAFQHQLLERYPHATTVSITFNIPGPVKYSAQLARIATQLMRALDAQLTAFELLYQKEISNVTGIGYYRVFQADALAVKRVLVEFEMTHPLGRLMDLDVVHLVAGRPVPISRTEIGVAPRTCFLCDQPAKVCARNRTHSVAEMQDYIMQLVQTFAQHTQQLNEPSSDERKLL